MSNDNETYLGDGLYASFVNGAIRLRAPREDGDHVVYLEIPVLDAFERYVESLRTEAEERVKAEMEKKE